MTGPMVVPQGGAPVTPPSADPNASLTAIAQGQIAGFNAQRDQQLQAILTHLGIVQQPLPTQASAQAAPPVSDSWHDDDLLGAAQFWGIPQEAARSMPRDHLIQILNQLRTQARPSDEQSSMLINAGSAASMFGVGALSAVTQGLHNLPVIGEALGRIGWVHSADIYFKGLEEGLRASTPESIQPVLSSEHVLGNLATLAVPANAAWTVMGKAPFVARMTPILRGAVQGAGSAWLLEGGSDAYEKAPGSVMLPAAALGAAFPLAAAVWKKMSPLLGATANKVTAAYVPEVGGVASETATAPTTATASGETATTQPLAPPEGLEQSHAVGTIPLSDAPLPQGFQVTSGELATFGDQFPGGASVMGAQIPAPPIAATARFDPSARSWQGIQTTTRRPAGLSFGDAQANAAGLNKAAIVLDSPQLPLLVKSTQMDETTVAKAASSINPGGTNLVQGVKDPAQFAQTVEGNMAFVSPPGTSRLDALVSDEPVTKQVIADYQRFGVYEGQEVTNKAGVVGKVQKINSAAQAIFKPANSDISISLPADELAPSAMSPASTEAPMLWKRFEAYTDDKTSAFVGQLSGPLAAPEQFAVAKQQNMGQYIGDFLDEAGIKGAGERARLTTYFNEQYVNGYKSLAPVESSAADMLAARAQSTPAMGETPLQALDSRATVKGFQVVPESDGGISLVDSVTPAKGQVPVEVKLQGLDEAHEWLGQYGDRQLPDATPKVDIPLETMAMQPTAGAQPNFNGTQQRGILNAIQDLGDGAIETPEYKQLAADLHNQAQALGPSEIGKLQNIYQNGLTNWSGMRRLFAKMDDFSQAAGMRDLGWEPFKDYDKISQAVNLRSNMEAPWLERWQGISQDITPANKRSGVWSQVYLNPDRSMRLVQGLKAGLSPTEMDAMDKMTGFWHDLFGETGLQAEREIPRYLPMLQKMQSTGDFSQLDQWQNVNPFHTAFFEQVRRGAVNVRELDPDVLANSYIKSWSWQNAMDAPFSDVAQRYNAIKQQVPELGAAADITQNWLQQIRHGYQEGNDPALDAAHAMLQTFVGPNITKQQARTLVNGAMQWSYQSLMGYRLDLAARDLQQIWMAFPRAGPKLLSVMNEFATGGTEARAAMWKESLDDNMVSLIHPRASSPGSEQFGADPSQPLSTVPNTPTQNALAGISDTVQGMKPAWMNDPRMSPSYLYGLQGEAIRMFSGIAGKRVAQEALATFRAGGSQDLDALMADSKAQTFYPAVQRQFQEYVTAGQDNEAAAFLGRQLADASQFKYGPAETPVNMRTITGKVGMQLGSYPMQYLQSLAESLQNGSTTDKVKLAATMGAVSAGFALATKATGWDFNRMNPYTGFGFAGGPVTAQAIQMAQAVTGGIDAATGQTRGGGGGSNTPSIGQALGNTAALFNPLGGAIRTAQSASQALQGPEPGLGLLRVGLTGESTNAPDVNDQLLPQAQAMFQQSLQPLHSPVSAGYVGTTQIPQQVVTQPLEMGGRGIGPSPTAGGAGGSVQPAGGLTQQQHYDSAATQLQRQGADQAFITHLLGPRP